MNDKPAYPSEFRCMEEVKMVVENYPREVWEPDLQDLVSRTQGCVIIGKYPASITKYTCKVTPVFCEEMQDVLANSDKWKSVQHIGPNATVTIGDKEIEMGSFEYNGNKYLFEEGTLPYAVSSWVDLKWIMNKLYGFDEVESVLKQREEEIRFHLSDVQWDKFNNEGDDNIGGNSDTECGESQDNDAGGN